MESKVLYQSSPSTGRRLVVDLFLKIWCWLFRNRKCDWLHDCTTLHDCSGFFPSNVFELAVFTLAIAHTTHMEDTDRFLPVFLTCGCVEIVRFLYEPALGCIMGSIVPNDPP